MKFKKLILSLVASAFFAVSAFGQVPDTVNVGGAANDATGDNLRSAFIKVNNNDQWLDQRLIEQSDSLLVVIDSIGVHTDSIYSYDTRITAATGSVYTADYGLTLVGTEFNLDTAVTDAKYLERKDTAQLVAGGGIDITDGGTTVTLAWDSTAVYLAKQNLLTNSAGLRGALSDETGTGVAVFGTSPTLVTPALGTPTALVLTNATGLVEAGLNATNAPTDNYILSYNDAGSNFTWIVDGGASADSSYISITTDSINALTDTLYMNDPIKGSVTATNAKATTLVSYSDLVKSVKQDTTVQTGTAYTLVLGDQEGLVTMNNGSANTLTVPPFVDVAFAIGTKFYIFNKGAGVCTITAGAAVTVEGLDLTLADTEGRTLIKDGTNTWVCF